MTYERAGLKTGWLLKSQSVTIHLSDHDWSEPLQILVSDVRVTFAITPHSKFFFCRRRALIAMDTRTYLPSSNVCLLCITFSVDAQGLTNFTTSTHFLSDVHLHKNVAREPVVCQMDMNTITKRSGGASGTCGTSGKSSSTATVNAARHWKKKMLRGDHWISLLGVTWNRLSESGTTQPAFKTKALVRAAAILLLTLTRFFSRFVMIFVLMSCFGGCGYWRRRQLLLTQQHHAMLHSAGYNDLFNRRLRSLRSAAAAHAHHRHQQAQRVHIPVYAGFDSTFPPLPGSYNRHLTPSTGGQPAASLFPQPPPYSEVQYIALTFKHTAWFHQTFWSREAFTCVFL